MKGNPLARGYTTSQNCSCSASGSSGLKSKERNLLFVCATNFCWATLCLHCWSSTFVSLQTENLCFPGGAENHQELSESTIILVSELCLKRNGNASRSVSFGPFSAFWPQLSCLTVCPPSKTAQTFAPLLFMAKGNTLTTRLVVIKSLLWHFGSKKEKKKAADWKVLWELILADMAENTHPSSRVTWFSKWAWEILFIIRNTDCSYMFENHWKWET